MVFHGGLATRIPFLPAHRFIYRLVFLLPAKQLQCLRVFLHDSQTAGMIGQNKAP
jgi:hypothetical protein